VPAQSHAVRWLPPLTVSRSEIDEAAAITRKVFSEL
jgi:acetylornithine/succinyldiaminopimelate/putrescine aminotransferase